MGAEIFWDDEEHTIVRIDYAGHWVWDDFVHATEVSTEMMRSVGGRADLIENMKPGVLPVSGSAVVHGRNALRTFPENMGVVVVVTNPYVRAMATLVVQLNAQYRNKVVLTDTLEQARSMILELRAKDKELQ